MKLTLKQRTILSISQGSQYPKTPHTQKRAIIEPIFKFLKEDSTRTTNGRNVNDF